MYFVNKTLHSHFYQPYPHYQGEANFTEHVLHGISDVSERNVVVQKHLEAYCKHLDPQQLHTICNTSLSHNPMYLVSGGVDRRESGEEGW